MLNKFVALWQRLTGSLWFVPTLIVVGAAGLAVVLIEMQSLVDREALRNFPRFFGAGADSSRSMLATIAGSMITVAGVTFSITVVAVSQASSQYTPRILRNFMRDRASQVVLGVFVGIFVYCLIVGRTIRSDEEIRFIPALAVFTAFPLAVIGIGFLVYFIHHIASSLGADSILARVRRETIEAVDRLFPDEMGEEAEPPPAAEPVEWWPITASTTGHIQGINSEGVVRLACAHDTVIRMDRGIGEFVVQGTVLASVADGAATGRVAASLRKLYEFSEFRTVYQDADFGIRQIVDIALKALSPSVNDSTTAITCVDQIGAILVRLARRRIERPQRADEHGRLRVLAHGPTFASLLATAVDEIRRNAASNVNVLARTLDMLGQVAACTDDEERRGLLVEHAQLITRTAEQNIPLEEDLLQVRQRYERVVTAARAPARRCAPKE